MHAPFTQLLTWSSREVWVVAFFLFCLSRMMHPSALLLTRHCTKILYVRAFTLVFCG